MSNTLDQISKEIDRISGEIAAEESDPENHPDAVLKSAMRKCERLEFNQAIAEEIISWRSPNKINELISHISQDGHENKKWFLTDLFDIDYLLSQLREKFPNVDLINKISDLLNQNHQRRKKMNIVLIVIIAFLIGLVVYLVQKSKEQKQENQTNSRQDNDQFNPTTSQPQTPVTTAQTQQTTVEKQFLVLVVPVSKKGSLESLRAKSKLDANDAGLLYEMTQFLWVGAESDYRAKMTQIAQSDMPSAEQSEYNYYLVAIELKEGASNRYKGFKPTVDSLTRSDAFRDLGGSDIKIEISARLKSQEALSTYGNFKLYNR